MGANRTAQEQHPFHLHGHHFWLLGQGAGLWEAVAGNASGVLNTVNPAYRDSFTVTKGGWVVLRFAVSPLCCALCDALRRVLNPSGRCVSACLPAQADNPGLWILHCHTDWHLFMGKRHSLNACIIKQT